MIPQYKTLRHNPQGDSSDEDDRRKKNDDTVSVRGSRRQGDSSALFRRNQHKTSQRSRDESVINKSGDGASEYSDKSKSIGGGGANRSEFKSRRSGEDSNYDEDDNSS